MSSSDVIKVGKASLESMAQQIDGTHKRLKDGFDTLSSDLLRTLPEWGEGTDSRNAYDSFKKRVDALFAEMFDAVAKMPPVVNQAAQEAESTEKRNSGMWAG